MATFLGIPISTPAEIRKNLGKILVKFLGTTLQSPSGGGIDASAFSLVSGVFKATVTLVSPFTGADPAKYNVLLTPLTDGIISFAAVVENRTASTYIINLRAANKTGLIQMMAVAIKQD